MITKRRVGWSVGTLAAASLAVGGIAQAQDVGGIVGEAWRVGGPIAAVVALMLVASGIAIRTLWTSLQTERTELRNTLEKRNTETGAYVRELRDCVTANTAALNRLADRLDETDRADRRHRS